MVRISGPSSGYYPEKIIAHQTDEGDLALLGEEGTRWIISANPVEVEQ